MNLAQSNSQCPDNTISSPIMYMHKHWALFSADASCFRISSKLMFYLQSRFSLGRALAAHVWISICTSIFSSFLIPVHSDIQHWWPGGVPCVWCCWAGWPPLCLPSPSSLARASFTPGGTEESLGVLNQGWPGSDVRTTGPPLYQQPPSIQSTTKSSRS